MTSTTEYPNRAVRRAVKDALCTVTALESLALKYANRGQDTSGAEITRTEFRMKLTAQADQLRQKLRDVLEQAILER